MKRVMSPQAQRDHKATLLRNIRAAQRNCTEHAQTLRQVFAPLLALKLPRIPRNQ